MGSAVPPRCEECGGGRPWPGDVRAAASVQESEAALDEPSRQAGHALGFPWLHALPVGRDVGLLFFGRVEAARGSVQIPTFLLLERQVEVQQPVEWPGLRRVRPECVDEELERARDYLRVVLPLFPESLQLAEVLNPRARGVP